MKKYMIKLFPDNGRIVENSIVRYKGEFYIVDEIVNKVFYKISNDKEFIVTENEITLFKYYVIYRNNILGELNFKDYDNVHNEMIVNEIRTREVPTKPELGDEIELIKPLLHNCDIRLRRKKWIGKIVDLQNRDATIDIYSEIITNVKRHRYRIINKPDVKTICYLV